MSFQHLLVLLLLQLHGCSASRPLGFILNASVINRNGSDSPMVKTATPGTSLKLSEEQATGVEDWKQIREESTVGTSSSEEGYGEEESDEAGEAIIHVKDDYHGPSGKSPIHNNKDMP